MDMPGGRIAEGLTGKGWSLQGLILKGMIVARPEILKRERRIPTDAPQLDTHRPAIRKPPNGEQPGGLWPGKPSTMGRDPGR